LNEKILESKSIEFRKKSRILFLLFWILKKVLKAIKKFNTEIALRSSE